MIEGNFSIINNVNKKKRASSEKLIKGLTFLKNNKKETKTKKRERKNIESNSIQNKKRVIGFDEL